MAKHMALISVHDKTGVEDFARGLVELGYGILSTGGTARAIRDAGVEVTDVSAVTGFPEVMDGRVKTLHPLIHAGILARPTAEHMAELAKIGGSPIDIVVSNLYPFQRTVESGAREEDIIENIDVGGPSMVRAAAKNFERVTVVVDPAHYGEILAELRESGSVSLAVRRSLAAEAFRHTAAYDCAISNYFAGAVHGDPAGPQAREMLTPEWTTGGVLVQSLRYGENPHQAAAFYRTSGCVPRGIAASKQLSGKELSFNNLADMDAAISTVREFDEPAVVIVKHGNPCGAGTGRGRDSHGLAEAFSVALECDPVSAFGGIVAANRSVDRAAAEAMKKLFLEVIAAPGFDDDALAVLRLKPNLRLIDMSAGAWQAAPSWDVRPVLGGFLVQQPDSTRDDGAGFSVVTKRAPDEREGIQLAYAWKLAAHVRSNAIVLWNGDGAVGVGAGQMNRVGAAKIAIEAAGERARGSVLASDGFFPFADTVELAADAGITAIIQPGGSVKDRDSIESANAHGLAMVFTGVRHFAH
ncbi:MAG: bifunctional phosphoribosylaminoimidazolecarboxamide formyltransferase/IMP cyclohydrolase [Clostridia bacterium]|nr:bifunctional phosphoribosylaminoimidazolecarboxamide formyltransferase/IMP cyclohydrolase [Clostridia bacterium]